MNSPQNIRILFGFLVLAIGIGFTLRNNVPPPQAKPAQPPPVSTGSDLKSLVIGFCQAGSVSKSIQEEAKKRGIDLRVADARQEQDQQISAIRGFIAQSVDAITFVPVAETGWEHVLEEARRAGIPVVIAGAVKISDETLYATIIEIGPLQGSQLFDVIKDLKAGKPVAKRVKFN